MGPFEHQSIWNFLEMTDFGIWKYLLIFIFFFLTEFIFVQKRIQIMELVSILNSKTHLKALFCILFYSVNKQVF